MGFGSFLKKAALAPIKMGVKSAKLTHNATMGAAKLGHKATRAAVTAPMKVASKTTSSLPGGGNIGKAMGKVTTMAEGIMGKKKKKPSPGIGPSMVS